jgi:hypothetical protein
MGDVLPSVFIIIAVVAMLGGLASLWLSLTLSLSDEATGDARAQLTSDARLALLTEKEALLQEIRDIAFEHDADKLSDIDYEEINAKLRAEARHVLHELDAGADDFREQAESLIADKLREAR